jgi:5''-3'' exonuclease (including N-terminal domain of PolI)
MLDQLGAENKAVKRQRPARAFASRCSPRWRLVCASRLSRPAKDDPAGRDRGGGAIVGFANFLLRLYEQEKPRAVVVAWDTLEEPTYRHEAFDGYQAGREFDEELLDQLDVLPDFVAACGL